MRTEWRDEWTTALRSGTYAEANGFLAHEDGAFSAVGVLVDVACDGYWIWDNVERTYAYEHHTYSLSDDVLDELELSREHERHVASLQTSGWSHAQIANWIDDTL